MGLRFFGLRQFQAFLASSACAACAGSYRFVNTSPLPWRFAFSQFWRVVRFGLSVLVPGSNSALKQTRLRRAA
ncbi:DUF1010 domain-containing protein [Oryzisolibacter propanilivorax]|uniref:DUF1010 domain-containing protein n=1 Tax=Oryzisolibacter propanilivorax TaxID=1527607 RepID=UPI001FE12292|nr:DUF1010 domain-containing protein [Oryzisolibacter propanilivorax]